MRLCHQHGDRKACINMHSGQALWCWLLNNINLMSLKLTMESSSYKSMFFPKSFLFFLWEGSGVSISNWPFQLQKNFKYMFGFICLSVSDNDFLLANWCILVSVSRFRNKLYNIISINPWHLITDIPIGMWQLVPAFTMSSTNVAATDVII